TGAFFSLLGEPAAAGSHHRSNFSQENFSARQEEFAGATQNRGLGRRFLSGLRPRSLIPGRGSQVARQWSAKPLSAVRFRLAPPRFPFSYQGWFSPAGPRLTCRIVDRDPSSLETGDEKTAGRNLFYAILVQSKSL